jgi:hypothetical protein
VTGWDACGRGVVRVRVRVSARVREGGRARAGSSPLGSGIRIMRRWSGAWRCRGRRGGGEGVGGGVWGVWVGGVRWSCGKGMKGGRDGRKELFDYEHDTHR